MAVDVATTMPQLDLRDQSIVTITLDDPGAVVTSFVLHFWQQLPPDPLTAAAPLLAVDLSEPPDDAEPDLLGGPGGT